jgi:hypothetical protein
VDKNSSKAHVAAPPTAAIAAANGTGSALFVINLCASIAPARLDGNNIPGLENYRLYQVARVEDGRTRHRLRLGFFTSESHAESVLTVVRQQYPTAFTACLCEEDRRFARGYLPETAAAQRPAAVSKPAPAIQPKPAAPTKQLAAAPAKQAAPAGRNGVSAPAQSAKTPPMNGAAKPAIAKQPAAVDPEVIELTWEPEPPKAQPKAATATPAAKAPAVSVTDILDEFTWEPPSLTPAAASAVAKSAAAKSTSDTAKYPALKIASKAPPAAKAATPAKPAAASQKPTASVSAKPTAPATATVASKPDSASSMRVRALQLSVSEPPPAPVEVKRTAPAEPFHVGKGVQFKDSGISLQAESPAAKPSHKGATQAKAKNESTAAVAKPTATKAMDKAAKPPSAPAAAKPAAPVIPPMIRISTSASVPELDSTQTIRALTTAELDDEQQDKWFAVQLAVSEQPVNLDAMPRLDIFEAYRLYSVATAGSGKIVHSLRLGFFKEAVSAEAVSGYLKTFFGSPSVMRISVAEHGRFKDPPSKKPAHEAKVVELNNARAARPVVPTVTMEVATPVVDSAATGSFKLNESGSFKVSATGAHKALGLPKSAAKSAGSNSKRAPRTPAGTTGKHKTLPTSVKKSLAEQLLEEAREVELSESGIRKLPKNDSLLSRMLGKLTK